MRAIALLFLFVVAAGIAAVIYLPWWGTVGLIVLFAVALKLLGERIFVAVLKLPFKAKGAVLRGATAEIHSVTPTSPQARKMGGDDDEDEAPAKPRKWFVVDVTIKPAAAPESQSGFQLWGPGELTLVSPTAKADDTDEDEDLCDIESVEIATEDGKFAADEGMKYGGPQRLRLTLAAAPEAKSLQFRYYFELFGEVRLPV